MNIYLRLTKRFNAGRVRAILAGGQAVVLHRLAIMSKDGDWIVREDEEALAHILSVLSEYGAHYRFGAPLDVRWMAAGWSSHLEFVWRGLRVRTDFFTRPPRLDASALKMLWKDQESQQEHFVDAKNLAELKKTNREKDYAVIGELARLLTEPDDRILYSRSARDLTALAAEHPDRIASLCDRRPALKAISGGLESLEAALDSERRMLIHANETRLNLYASASEDWARAWPGIAEQITGLSLGAAHKKLVSCAGNTLPCVVPGGLP